MIMTSQHFLNHVKQIIGRTFHIILFFDMITTYTQLYLVFGGIIDFYSQKIFFLWFDYLNIVCQTLLVGTFMAKRLNYFTWLNKSR